VIRLRNIDTSPRPAFRYTGSKRGVSRIVLKLLKDLDVDTFCEPYAGSAAVTFVCKAAYGGKIKRWCINDLDKDLIAVFHAIKERGEELAWECMRTPYSHEALMVASSIYNQYFQADEKPRRFPWAFMINKNFSFASSASLSRPGQEASFLPDREHMRFSASIKRASGLLQDVEITSMDALECIKKYDSPRTMFFLDPPYVLDTRVSQELYLVEASIRDHVRLLETCLAAQGKMVITGYRCPEYDRLIGHWKTIERRVRSGGSGNSFTRIRTECVWLRT